MPESSTHDGLTLPGGVTYNQIRDAVVRSGYPSQGMVIDKLIEVIGAKNPEFPTLMIQEEWSFIDDDSNAVRQIDALVDWLITSDADEEDNDFSRARDNFADAASWIRTHLNFLVECKQSDLPYVAFTRNTTIGCRIPLLFGLPHETLSLIFRSDRELSMGMGAADALGTWDLGFPELANAVSIAKAHRKGKELELSGEEMYKGLALPMLKALEYFRKTSKAHSKKMYFDVRVVFPIVVIRAPLVGVQVKEGNIELRDLPWARLVRSEPDEPDLWWNASVSGFDVVQFDHLTEYAAAAKKAAIEISERIKSFATQLLTGKAVFSDEDSVTEADHPYKTLLPHVNPQELAEILRKNFLDAHN